MHKGQAARMGAPVGGKEIAPLILREMAKLEHRIEMLRRDRHGIGGIGDLRNERAVLAERLGQTLPRPGRPIVQHPLEDGLVFDHRSRRRRRDRSIAHRPSRDGLSRRRRRSTRPIAALVAASAAGATDSERSPAASNAPIASGSPPASPHRLTSRPLARPCSATIWIKRSTAGFSGLARSATAAMSRPAAVTYCVRSFEPIEKKAAASKRSIARAAAGTSTMMPSGGGAPPSAPPPGAPPPPPGPERERC